MPLARVRVPAMPLPARLRPHAFAAQPLGLAPRVTHPSCHGVLAPAGRSIPPKPRCPNGRKVGGLGSHLAERSGELGRTMVAGGQWPMDPQLEPRV